MKSTNWNVGTSWILQWQDLIRYEFIYDHFVVDKISKEILGLIKFSARQNIEFIWRLFKNGKKLLWQYKAFCCRTNVHIISWIYFQSKWNMKTLKGFYVMFFPLLDQHRISRVDCVNKINARALFITGSFQRNVCFLTRPIKRNKIWKFLPILVVQEISPYPTVDIVTIRKYTHSQ